MKKHFFIGFLAIVVMVVILLQVSVFKSISQPQAHELVKAAQSFLSTLDNEQKEQVTYELGNDERFNWHFVPKDDRKGLSLNEMNEDQRKAAKSMIQASLSKQGYENAMNVMELESILRVIEGRGTDDKYRDPNKYFFTIFGAPSAEAAWGWRFEGHHISLNFSALSGELVSGTPAFFGANPARVPSGPKEGWRILQLEEDLGRELVQSLTTSQMKAALIAGEAYPDILTGTNRQADKTALEGLAYEDMTSEQQQKLMQLLEVYFNKYKSELAYELMERTKKAGLEQMHFAWAGGIAPGEKHYYRIQNPVVIIEYDNTQNNGNHIHTVVRDLGNDFGDDVLKKHYEEAHN